MRDLCFTSLCFIIIFYASVEHSAGSAAPDPPQQLTCNGTKNPDGSFTYQLVPAPTVTEYTSSSWANASITFADDGDKTADVQNLTNDSVTLKLCQENVTYKLDGANPQEASCHVNCSGLERTTPSAEHRWCLSDDRCPPVRDVLLVVGVLVLVVVGALGALVFYRRIHPRCSRGSEEEPSVKSSSAVEVPLLEMKTVSESH
ncbi:uncharacterized protein isoform X1 [Takifugu rubripes]|uniref:uncharacterized protein isoform X1 n=1 Tax=Takifugu rubripes TaxID=31033 RepID=UPI001145212C|nr:uncharacterized protein LOC105419489 isoform X1 [Takifugu rubripes]